VHVNFIERARTGRMSSLTFDFSGRTAIVTGGARGIGRALGSFFVVNGATTFLADMDADAVAATAAEIGAVGVQCDVSDSSSADQLVATAVEQTG
jgi:3-oxoacyl-[acyl-carrier protein] reductase